MNETHEKGKCDLCRCDKMVRWKNIYWQGSEGLWCCQECENKIVRFVHDLASQSLKAKLFEAKRERGFHE